MTTLPAHTWEYYAYWMVIGLAIYFCYGMWFSNERPLNKLKPKKEAVTTHDKNDNLDSYT